MASIVLNKATGSSSPSSSLPIFPPGSPSPSSFKFEAQSHLHQQHQHYDSNNNYPVGYLNHHNPAEPHLSNQFICNTTNNLENCHDLKFYPNHTVYSQQQTDYITSNSNKIYQNSNSNDYLNDNNLSNTPSSSLSLSSSTSVSSCSTSLSSSSSLLQSQPTTQRSSKQFNTISFTNCNSPINHTSANNSNLKATRKPKQPKTRQTKTTNRKKKGLEFNTNGGLIGLVPAESVLMKNDVPSTSPLSPSQSLTKIVTTNSSNKRKKSKDPNEPQKPVSPYALFFRDTQPSVKVSHPQATFGEISKLVASLWEKLDANLKEDYKKRTAHAKKDYLKLLAVYRATQATQQATCPQEQQSIIKEPAKKIQKMRENQRPFQYSYAKPQNSPKHQHGLVNVVSQQTPQHHMPMPTNDCHTGFSSSTLYNQQSPYMILPDDFGNVCHQQQSYANYQHQQHHQQQRLSPYSAYQTQHFQAHYEPMSPSLQNPTAPTAPSTATQDYFHDQQYFTSDQQQPQQHKIHPYSYNHNSLSSNMANTNSQEAYANWLSSPEHFYQQANTLDDNNNDYNSRQEQHWYQTTILSAQPASVNDYATQNYGIGNHNGQPQQLQHGFLVDASTNDFAQKYQNFNNWTTL